MKIIKLIVLFLVRNKIKELSASDETRRGGRPLDLAMGRYVLCRTRNLNFVEEGVCIKTISRSRNLKMHVPTTKPLQTNQNNLKRPKPLWNVSCSKQSDIH